MAGYTATSRASGPTCGASWRIGARNSQPLFFSILLRQRYGDRRMPSDVERYVDRCQAGQFYDHLMNEWGIQTKDRGEFKQKFFGRVFFCENWPEVETAKRFGEQYPNVYALIREMKAKDYT